MKNIHKNLLKILIFIFFSFGFAQDVIITYENPSGIEIFGSEEVYKVSILNNTLNAIDVNSILTINLPLGISYVENSVEGDFITIPEMDVNNPDFIVINTIAVGDTVVLEFKAVAMCNSYSSINDSLDTIKNRINYSYSIANGSQLETIFIETDNYNLSFSNVNLELPTEIWGIANQTLEFNTINELLTQNLNISIPGNSTEFSIFQININPSSELEFMGISELIINSENYSALGIGVVGPMSTSTATNLIFKATDIDPSLLNFSANMLIEIKLNFRSKSCFIRDSQHVEYESVIGSIDDGNCVIARSIGDFEFFPSSPDLSYTFNSDDGLSLCGNTSKVVYTMSNAPDALAPALDVHLLLSGFLGGGISNIKINDIPVDTMIYAPETGNKVHLFGNNIPGLIDLTDEDGDGEIDDLAPGASIRVTCDVSLEFLPEQYSLTNCDIGFYGRYFVSEFYSLNSECEISYSTDNGLYSAFKLNNTGKSANLLLDTDINETESNHIQFCFERNSGGNQNQIYDDTMLLEANIEIPCGAELNLNLAPTFTSQYGTELGVIATTSIINEKTILNLEVIDPYVFSNFIGAYGGCFEFDLLLNCDSFSSCTNTDPLLEATVFGAFSECPNQKMNLGCEQKRLYMHCVPVMPLCPSPFAIMANDFEAVRTSYGTTIDGTQITIEGVDNGNFSGLNTKGAYAGDNIRAEITGLAICNIGSNQAIYGYIWYSHPENFPFLTMTGAEYINDSGNLITVSDFSIRTDLSTAIKTVYEIQVNDQEVSDGSVIKIRGNFSVDKAINNSSIFPNVYTFTKFRGGFNLNSNPPPAPLHYGTDFEVYSLDYFEGFSGTPATCSGGGNFDISFNVEGGFGDDFPNEFRSVIQIIGPLDVIIPAGVNDEIVMTRARYSVTGVSGLPDLGIDSVVDSPGVFRIYDVGYGSLEEFRPFDKTSTIMYCSIRIQLELNDCALPAGQTIEVVGSHLEQGYSEEPVKEVIETDYPVNIASDGSGFAFGDLNIDIVNPFFQTVEAVTKYKINIDNTNDQLAKYPWIKFTYPDDLITISNSTIDGYNIVESVYGTNTLLLKLQSINPGCVMEGYIDVVLNNCGFEDQHIDIQIESGVSCKPITNDFFNNDDTLCPLDMGKNVELEIIKSNLRMDVIPLSSNSIPLQYCDSYQYIVQIYNNEKANITNPSFKVDVPDGFEMNVQYRYPVTEAIDPTNVQFYNSGFSQSINIVSGQLWGLEQLNGILPGYVVNQSDYLNNYYQLLVTLTPTCGYDGVSPINFSTSGVTNCNEDKYITFQSTPTFVELDALNNYTHQLSFDVEQNVNSGNYTAIINYFTDTYASGSLGELTVSLPEGIYSSDNLSFVLPSTGGADFMFNFATDPEYCGDVNFLMDTIIDIELGCDTNTTCVRTVQLQDILTENICMQECFIKNVDVETIIGISCLNYSLNAISPSISNGDIDSYSWVLTDVNNNLIGNYSGNGIEVNLPNIGAPFTAVLTIVGMNNVGSMCQLEKAVILTPSCEQCSIDTEITISSTSDVCNSVTIIPNVTVYNGEINSYSWSIYDEHGNEVEIIHFNTIIPEPLIYDFLGSGTYKVCLKVNSSNLLGETCNDLICKEVVVNCTPCSVDAKFSTKKIIDCTYQFNNHSIVNNWNDVEYFWDFGDGSSSAEFEPNHTYTFDGDYDVYLIVTALNSINDTCESTFGPIKIEANGCSQDEECINISDKTDVDLFPNPNNGIFTLSFKNCIKYCEVSVYDVVGKVIYRKIMRNENHLFIDISNCAKGAYLVKASSSTMSKTKKIIIE